jgi:hypothetical protein
MDWLQKYCARVTDISLGDFAALAVGGLGICFVVLLVLS